MTQQIRGKAPALERFVNYFKKEIPPKPYILKKPPHPRELPYPYWIKIVMLPYNRWMERQGVHFYNQVMNKTEIGLYPKEWNPRVHGIYCHWRYYGPNPDVPIWEVKIKDLPQWLKRRDFTPRAMVNEIGRWFHQLMRDYMSPAFQSPIDILFRFWFFAAFLFFVYRCILTDQLKGHNHAIYHW